MAWTALFAAVQDPSGGWTVEAIEREESVEALAYELSERYGVTVVCFVVESDVAYVIAEADDGARAALVFNEHRAHDLGMDFLPVGRAAEAARELAAWSRIHAPQAVAADEARRVLTTEHAHAEEGVAEMFALLGLPWPWGTPGE